MRVYPSIARLFIWPLVWFVGCVLTFGHEVVAFERAGHSLPPMDAIMAALFWPIYWPFNLSWEFFA